MGRLGGSVGAWDQPLGYWNLMGAGRDVWVKIQRERTRQVARHG